MEEIAHAGPARARVPLAIGDDQKLCQEQCRGGRAKPRCGIHLRSPVTPTSVNQHRRVERPTRRVSAAAVRYRDSYASAACIRRRDREMRRGERGDLEARDRARSIVRLYLSLSLFFFFTNSSRARELIFPPPFSNCRGKKNLYQFKTY